MYYHHSHQLRDSHHFFYSSRRGRFARLQAPPQPCSIKHKTDSDNIEPDDNNNNNNNNKKKNNYMIIIIAIIRKITIIAIQINKGK